MKKKIAVFANGWSAENLRYYMESLSEHLNELNAELYVFMGHDAFGMRPIHNDAQCSIYTLPHLEDYDAIIFFALGMDFVQINEAIFARCRQSGVPMIVIGKTLDGAVSIYTDQYKGMKPLVDHLLEKHNVRKILFIAGPKDHFDSNERLRATMDSCKEHGVPFSGDDVFYSNWDVMSATTYIRKLLNKKAKLPDVIMCANDTTAFFISFVFGRVWI